MSIVYIWGAGGHGRVVLDCAATTAGEIIFLDDDPSLQNSEIGGRRVLNASLELARLRGGASFLVAIGDNRIRADCFQRALDRDLRAATFVHPAATVSPSALVSEGTVVMPGAVINAGARVGRNCIVNTGAIVEHDCVIGDHSHISPRAALGGNATVGSFVHVGIGAVVLPGITIHDSAVVGAGSVVLKSVPRGVTVAGVPAHVLSESAGR